MPISKAPCPEESWFQQSFDEMDSSDNGLLEWTEAVDFLNKIFFFANGGEDVWLDDYVRLRKELCEGEEITVPTVNCTTEE